jgi:hypothetical protein
MKNFIIYTSTLLFLITFSGCGSGTNCGDIDAANMLPGDSDFESIIEDFNKTFYKNNLSNEFVDATNVYVDLSDGITKYALGNTNNKNLLEQFFFTVQNQENLNYYELSNNQVQKYEGTQALSYFISNGHKDDNGKLKMGAPIDKAFNDIASKNELGIVITDGELYDSVAKEVSMNPWASDAFKSWFSSGGKLNILYTDFTEKNSGKSYNKHMYLIIFIPNGYDGNLVESLTTDFNDNNIVFNSMKFNTDVSKLHTREYPDSQTPGTLALNEFGSISGYFSESNFEYFDLEEIADFHTEEGGVVYYTRDQLNDNGKPINKPLLEKLYLDLESIENYSVDNIKIKISNVSGLKEIIMLN